MRWVLPGGAVLGANGVQGDEQAVACRPGVAVVESMRPPRPPTIRERLRRRREAGPERIRRDRLAVAVLPEGPRHG